MFSRVLEMVFRTQKMFSRVWEKVFGTQKMIFRTLEMIFQTQKMIFRLDCIRFIQFILPYKVPANIRRSLSSVLFLT